MNEVAQVISLGMELERHTYKSCTADFGVDEKWATVYNINSETPGKGHARKLLENAKEYYKGKEIGGTVALNPTMKHLYNELGYKEYN